MKKLVISTLTLLCSFAMFAQAATFLPNTNTPPLNVTLAWDYDTNTIQNIGGFNMYVGIKSGTYTNVIKQAGTNLTLTVSNLVRGVTYYFACSAVDKSGLESDLSNEVNYRGPGRPIPPIMRPLNQFGSAMLKIQGEVYGEYMLEQTDLASGWTPDKKLQADSRGLLEVSLVNPDRNHGFFRVVPRQ